MRFVDHQAEGKETNRWFRNVVLEKDTINPVDFSLATVIVVPLSDIRYFSDDDDDFCY